MIHCGIAVRLCASIIRSHRPQHLPSVKTINPLSSTLPIPQLQHPQLLWAKLHVERTRRPNMDHIDVPFLDLVTPHVEMEEQLVAEFRAALRTAGFIGGKPVDNFEAAFAEFCDTRYCVGVGSGTDALRFALTAAGVAPGDSVLTV